jgi:hypothetical protein
MTLARIHHWRLHTEDPEKPQIAVVCPSNYCSCITRHSSTLFVGRSDACDAALSHRTVVLGELPNEGFVVDDFRVDRAAWSNSSGPTTYSRPLGFFPRLASSVQYIPRDGIVEPAGLKGDHVWRLMLW